MERGGGPYSNGMAWPRSRGTNQRHEIIARGWLASPTPWMAGNLIAAISRKGLCWVYYQWATPPRRRGPGVIGGLRLK